MEEQKDATEKQKTETKSILNDLVNQVNTVTKPSTELKEWYHNFDEDLHLKFEEQNVIIAEAIEE
eukprot:9622995-Ditylum_brightwellii.AAC.2